ncbi:hypothetical protein GWI33_014618 [Rhynchophorus ferrugineus]|uniref:Uncharacterized protein n=1 Tax=Rhynchophorus ferrugineus TaxID=354439 RepID=A0A834M5A9_RHYFE|nr:hypothetical protein GWI33_014618 [Rhynchophorus ferrugineus]
MIAINPREISRYRLSATIYHPPEDANVERAYTRFSPRSPPGVASVSRYLSREAWPAVSPGERGPALPFTLSFTNLFWKKLSCQQSPDADFKMAGQGPVTLAVARLLGGDPQARSLIGPSGSSGVATVTRPLASNDQFLERRVSDDPEPCRCDAVTVARDQEPSGHVGSLLMGFRLFTSRYNELGIIPRYSGAFINTKLDAATIKTMMYTTWGHGGISMAQLENENVGSFFSRRTLMLSHVNRFINGRRGLSDSGFTARPSTPRPFNESLLLGYWLPIPTSVLNNTKESHVYSSNRRKIPRKSNFEATLTVQRPVAASANGFVIKPEAAS